MSARMWWAVQLALDVETCRRLLLRREREEVLERLLAGGGGSARTRGWAMEALASAVRAGGEIDRARDLFEQAVALADEAEDDELASQALVGIAWLARMKGRFQEAFDYAEQARARSRAAGKPGLEVLAAQLRPRGSARSGLVNERQFSAQAPDLAGQTEAKGYLAISKALVNESQLSAQAPNLAGQTAPAGRHAGRDSRNDASRRGA